MTEMEIYWILKLNMFCGVSVFLTIAGCFAGIVFLVNSRNEDVKEEYWAFFKKLGIFFIIVGLLFAPLAIFLPTTNQMIKIKVYPMLLTKDGIKNLKKIPPKLLKLLDLSLNKLEKAIKSR